MGLAEWAKASSLQTHFTRDPQGNEAVVSEDGMLFAGAQCGISSCVFWKLETILR